MEIDKLKKKIASLQGSVSYYEKNEQKNGYFLFLLLLLLFVVVVFFFFRGLTFWFRLFII